MHSAPNVCLKGLEKFKESDSKLDFKERLSGHRTRLMADSYRADCQIHQMNTKLNVSYIQKCTLYHTKTLRPYYKGKLMLHREVRVITFFLWLTV
jgi:hypothetical protein